jgi:hypothetical protein
MYGVIRCLFLISISIALVGCSKAVPAEKVYGTYVASHPFGMETLTLNRDGSFVQRVDIENQSPVTVQGSWSFDPSNSYVTFHGYLQVADGFGKLRSDWRVVPQGIVALPVERVFFKIVLNSGAQYPYAKQ